MKTLKDIIQEKLIINKNSISAKKELTNQEKIQEVINLGKENGLHIIFRNRKTDTGDFCFFIYDKRKQSNYLVGYDGDWNAKEDDNRSFENCYQASLKYIENYKG